MELNSINKPKEAVVGSDYIIPYHPIHRLALIRIS